MKNTKIYLSALGFFLIGSFNLLHANDDWPAYFQDFSVADQGFQHENDSTTRTWINNVETPLADVLDGGTATGAGGWTLSWNTLSSDTTANFAKTSGGAFTAADTGSLGLLATSGDAITLISANIDITNIPTFTFIGTGTGTNAWSPDDGSGANGEEFRWFYTLDGGTTRIYDTTQVNKDSGASLNDGFADDINAPGNTLQIGFEFDGNGSGGINITQLGILIPEPSTITLFAFGFLSLLLIRKRK